MQTDSSGSTDITDPMLIIL